MRWRWLTAMAFVLTCNTVNAASAQDLRIEIGLLTCNLALTGEDRPASLTEPMSQTRDALCSFRPLNSGLEEHYVGTVQSFGQDRELLYKGTMIFVVKSDPNTDISPGLLQQSYTVEVASGVTGRAPAPLTGDTNRRLVLQSIAEKEVADDDPQLPTKKKTEAPEFTVALVVLKLKSTPA
jgi:Protein of unknown function (DUF992)